MATINEYIDQLKSDRTSLVNNLETKGIQDLTGHETFTTLVPKVLDIQTDNTTTTSTTITSNGTTVLTPTEPYTGFSEVTINTNVQASVGDYFVNTLSGGTYHGVREMIKKIPDNTILGNDSLAEAFRQCYNLLSFPNLDTSGIEYWQNAFYDCTNLADVPVFNFSRAGNLTDMFRNCTHLTNTSLNNIMASCITATSYSRTKTLYALGLRSDNYSASTIQGLSNYSAFTSAGWSIGW